MAKKLETETQKEVVLRLKGISDLIGALNRDAIHACFGQSQVGKTTLWLEALYDISDQLGKPVLYYDTEGGGAQFVEQWEKIYKEKYPNAQVDVRMKRDFRAILKDHGKLVKPKYSGGKAVSEGAKEKTSGKLSIMLVDEDIESPIAKLIQEKGYGAIYYDSITMPMKFFGAEQQNFPARNYAQTLWFSEMLNLIDEHKVYVIASHHGSKNPADPYAVEQMAGGSAVQYYCKVILHMKKWKAKGATSYRTIKLVRYFNKAPNEHETLIKLTDKGYVDATMDDMEADKKSARS